MSNTYVSYSQLVDRDRHLLYRHLGHLLQQYLERKYLLCVTSVICRLTFRFISLWRFPCCRPPCSVRTVPATNSLPSSQEMTSL
jgi:hypothetical protein